MTLLVLLVPAVGVALAAPGLLARRLAAPKPGLAVLAWQVASATLVIRALAATRMIDHAVALPGDAICVLWHPCLDTLVGSAPATHPSGGCTRRRRAIT